MVRYFRAMAASTEFIPYLRPTQIKRADGFHKFLFAPVPIPPTLHLPHANYFRLFWHLGMARDHLERPQD